MLTDPVCPWSWALEPALRRLLQEFAGSLQITYVMCGMVHELEGGAEGETVLKLACAKVAALCGLSFFTASARLRPLAEQGRIRAERVQAGELWSLA